MADDTTVQPPLSADDVKSITGEINKYGAEFDEIAKQNGINVKIDGNSPGELTAAAATGAATGAATAAVIAPAAGPFAPLVIAAGAIIGALAGFFAKFKFGPSPEAIALTKEFDDLNKVIHGVLAKVPQPYQRQVALTMINAMKRAPGPLIFCLEGGGCAMTSIQGVRDAAAGLDALIKDVLAKHQAPPSFFTPRRITFAIVVLGLGGAAYYAEKRR